jgi:hypothetical protein
MLLRVLASMLAFLVSFDLLFADGRYTVKQMALTALRRF